MKKIITTSKPMKININRVSGNWKITIPVIVKRALNLKEDDELIFKLLDDKTINIDKA